MASAAGQLFAFEEVEYSESFVSAAGRLWSIMSHDVTSPSSHFPTAVARASSRRTGRRVD